MEFRILGTGSATPLANRNPSAFTLTIDHHHLLIDCGEGTQARLLEYKIKLGRIKYILISHLHGDHYFGLIGLLSSYSLNGRTEPLTVFGPKGLDEIITIQLKYSKSVLSFDLTFVETNPTEPQLLFENESFTINTFPMQHRVDTTGFLICKKLSKRKIHREALPENFPASYFKLLQEGHDVYDELTGITYKNEDFTSDGTLSKRFAYCSDTVFDENLIQYIENTDLLYHEATFGNELEKRAKETFHSTAAQAATMALKSNAKKLIIGHFSSRYKNLEPLLEEAKVVFEATHLAIEGKNYIF